MENERVCPEELEWINRTFCTCYDYDRIFLTISGEKVSNRGVCITNVIYLKIINYAEYVTAVFFVLSDNLFILLDLG
mgnify:FL=1